jgi:hypothetical protein
MAKASQTIKVVLDGTKAGGDGLRIENASGSVIKGLVVNGFFGSAIDISSDSVGTRIEGNFLGTDPTGTLNRGTATTACKSSTGRGRPSSGAPPRPLATS